MVFRNIPLSKVGLIEVSELELIVDNRSGDALQTGIIDSKKTRKIAATSGAFLFLGIFITLILLLF